MTDRLIVRRGYILNMITLISINYFGKSKKAKRILDTTQ
jgi:hypothetical protein